MERKTLSASAPLAPRLIRRRGAVFLAVALPIALSGLLAFRTSQAGAAPADTIPAPPDASPASPPPVPDPAPPPSTAAGADEPGPNAKFLPASVCSSPACHGALVEEFQTLRHSHYVSDERLGPAAGCGVCHGPASDHVADSAHRRIPRLTEHTRANARRIDRACISCHEETIRRPHYQATEHTRAGMSCATCHEVHYDLKTPYLLRYPGVRGPAGAPFREKTRPGAPVAPAGPPPAEGAEPPPNPPKLERAARTRIPLPQWRSSFSREPDAVTAEQAINELCASCHRRELTEHRQLSHHPLFEGRITCTQCHGAHHAEAGAGGTRMLARRSVEETCLQCHQHLRGPFVFEHQPVRTGGIGHACLECHRPHGSPNRSLTVLFSRGLCVQCHIDIQQDRNHRFRVGDCWRAGCHSAVHGSNREPLLFEE